MQDLLLHCGIKAKAKYIHTGSMKGSWYVHNMKLPVTGELFNRLNDLGFRDFWGNKITSCNCPNYLSVHLKGFDELLVQGPLLKGFGMPLIEASIPVPEYTTQSQLLAAKSAINSARALWHYRCDQDYHKNGDTGTCVLGAGIVVPLLPPRCKVPRTHMVISADEVSCAQGSLNWERSVDEIVELLRPHLPGVYYACGRMD